MEEEKGEETIPEEEIPVVEEDFKAKYLLLLAEMENARKRLLKEKQETIRFAIENVLLELLTPLDTFENALGFAEKQSDETRNWAMGFQMILSQFKDILHDHGVVAFSAMGEKFDPHRHDAVEVEETHDHEDGAILQEFMKGYKCGDRILRAARVKVAKTPQAEEIQEEGEENDGE